jgi:Tetratricopeptide repeat
MRRNRLIGIIAASTIALLAAVPTVSFGQSLKEADVLKNKVIELYNAGKYTQAISIAEKVLSIREKTLGPNHPNVASSLNTLANLYLRQNR